MVQNYVTLNPKPLNSYTKGPYRSIQSLPYVGFLSVDKQCRRKKVSKK